MSESVIRRHRRHTRQSANTGRQQSRYGQRVVGTAGSTLDGKPVGSHCIGDQRNVLNTVHHAASRQQV